MEKLQKLIFLVTLLLLFSCEDVIEVELPEAEKRLVVDAWLNTLSETQVVKLSYTGHYFDSNPTPRVTGATVSISDDLGNVFEMSEEEAGVYRNNFVPLIGRSYKLQIVTSEGNEYQSSPEILLPVPALDDLYFDYLQRANFQEEGYYVFIDFRDPPGVKNFYRWRYYVNGVLQNKPEHFIIENDDLVDGNELSEIRFNWEPLELGDVVRIEQASVTEEAFNFLYIVREQITSGRGTFDAPPAVIKGNIVNINNPNETVLGYFGASDVDAKEVVIEVVE